MSDDKFTREVGEDLQILLANTLAAMLRDQDKCTASVLREAREFLKNQGIDQPIVKPGETNTATDELKDALVGYHESNVTKLYDSTIPRKAK